MLLCISLHLEDIFHENIINDIRVIESNKKIFFGQIPYFDCFMNWLLLDIKLMLKQ